MSEWIHAMNAQQALELLSEHMPQMRQQFGVRSLAIFGSVARNEARADGDVDVLVEYAEAPTLRTYMGLKRYLEDLFGTRVDLATAGSIREEIRSNVESELVHVP